MTLMNPTMMHDPLSTQIILRHGATTFKRSQIIDFDGTSARTYSFAEIADQATRLASGLSALGVKAGERVATFCWNHSAHMAAYLGVPSMGAILHTLNIRLFPAQVNFIFNHAQDKVVLVDSSLLPQLTEALNNSVVEIVIVIGEDIADIPPLKQTIVSYEDLLRAQDGSFSWPEIDENQAAAVCYTSGTTGDPKGVVYSHKTIYIHSFASMATDTFGISQHDRILLVPPMFHANAWGLPYSGWFAGSDIIMPGPHLQADKLRILIDKFRPSFCAMVPTLVNELIRLHAETPIDLSCFRVIVSGGSAVAPALINKLKSEWGVPVIQGWGMTETSPLCALSVPPREANPEDDAMWRTKSGRTVPGIQVRIVDDQGNELPQDGSTVGNLELKGPWVSKSYYDRPDDNCLSSDGWLKTGDVGSIDPHGFVQITDRTKDVIKSGGEWISSVEIENIALEHPAISEAAVIGIADPRWEERPLVIFVGKPDTPFSDLKSFFANRVARFMIPEYWARVDALPRTGVGKIDKRLLRSYVEEKKIKVDKV